MEVSCDNWSCKTCKVPFKLSPPTNQHPVFLQAGCPSCSPTNGVRALMGKESKGYGREKLLEIFPNQGWTIRGLNSNSICKIYCRLLCSPAWSAKQYNLVLKQYNLVPANGRWCLAAGKVTVGLASHWPCVTDNSGITAYGLMALEREISTPPIPSRSVAQFTLSLLSSLIMVVHNQSVVLVYLTI